MAIIFSGPDMYQGRFVSDETATFIPLPTDVDSIEVYNETLLYGAGAGTGAQFYWQRGMANGRGLIYTKTVATNALVPAQIAAGAGFYLTDTSVQVPGPLLATTGITAATPPVITAVAGTTSQFNTGDIIRVINTPGALQFGGIDFTVGTIIAGASIELPYGPTIAATGAVAGSVRRIPYDPIFYPRRRIITNITQAAQAVVTLSVTHGYLVGQKILFVIPTVTALAYGMTELNGVEATIVAVNTVTNTITVDVDTTGMTAFAWPLTADPTFTPAQVIPVGENTATAIALGVNPFNDATFNTAQFGITLMAGANSPAGVITNVIYWRAYKSGNL
jgi:hypothetical protein